MMKLFLNAWNFSVTKKKLMDPTKAGSMTYFALNSWMSCTRHREGLDLAVPSIMEVDCCQTMAK